MVQKRFHSIAQVMHANSHVQVLAKVIVEVSVVGDVVQDANIHVIELVNSRTWAKNRSKNHLGLGKTE